MECINGYVGDMNVLKKIIGFLFLITGGYGMCNTTENITDGVTIHSPDYPSYHGEHHCEKYNQNYISPPTTTISIECTDFDVQCRDRYNFFGVIGNIKKCGKSFPNLTTSENFLGIEYQAKFNREANIRKRSIFRFECRIQVHYPEAINYTTCTCPVWDFLFNTRIISGTDAKEGEFPYQVAIMKNGQLENGATLIADKWVLTTATSYIDTSYQARMGFIRMKEVSPNELTRNIISVTPHPMFGRNTYRFDILLAELEEPVTFTAFIRPICLPDDLLEETLDHKTATATGYGTVTTNGDDHPDVLQKVTLDIISNEECAVEYGNRIFAESLCTMTEGKDTCTDDGGGPLSYSHNGKIYLIGITSWGRGCAAKGIPAVYTRVANRNVINWIRKTIGVTCGSPLLASGLAEINAALEAAEMSTLCKDCGKRMSKFHMTRIVGGEAAKEGEFPYQVGFTIFGEHYCGGSLISRHWIVTAAHCTVHRSHKVILGEYNTFKKSRNEKEFGIAQVLNHPHYNETTLQYDIALVKLRQPVIFTDYIHPICLPDIFTNETFEGKFAVASGWGYLEEDGYSPKLLQKVTLDVISNQECSELYKNIQNARIDDLALCTLTNGKDTCQGDSGGPLAYQHHGRFYLIGLVSWGLGCALKDSPGVYIRVSHPTILSWIKDNAGITCSSS